MKKKYPQGKISQNLEYRVNTKTRFSQIIGVEVLKMEEGVKHKSAYFTLHL
jgi:hypothetical protein